MVTETYTTANAVTISRELEWFSEVLDTRLKLYFGHESAYASVWDVSPPAFDGNESAYARFINRYKLGFAERVVLLLALIPHVRPQLLDVFWVKNATYDRGFSEFGGIKGSTHSGFIPTGETALFLLAGNDLDIRFSVAYLFAGDHFFATHQVLHLAPAGPGEPSMSGALNLSRDVIELFTTGNTRKPNFSADFPARLITTNIEWNDLVLPGSVAAQLEEIKAWIEFGDILMNDWQLGRKLKPGFRCLFYGPSGTGKSLTACLLGKHCDRDVYRIDLSQVVSKYIGETEKNLSRIFDQAEHKQWILFFDEADALFGKRTKVDSAHDRYANQEVSYLLQRIEDFNGIVILASNLKANIDDAFSRRFQAIIEFPLPKPDERQRLWEKSFSPASQLEATIDLKQLSHKYDLTGGTIINVVRYSSLMALRRRDTVITLQDLEEGIRKEYQKEGRIYR